MKAAKCNSGGVSSENNENESYVSRKIMKIGEMAKANNLSMSIINVSA